MASSVMSAMKGWLPKSMVSESGSNRAQNSAGPTHQPDRNPGAGRDPGLDIGGLHPEALFRAQGHRHGGRTGLGNQALIGRIKRVTDQHLIARLHQRSQHGIKDGLGAGQAHDLIAPDLAATTRGIARGKGSDEARFAPAVGIAGPSRGHRPDSLGGEFGRGRHVGLTDGKFDDVVTGGFHLAGAGVQRPFGAAKSGKAFSDGSVFHDTGFRNSGSLEV